MATTGQYEASRLPGHPLQEILYSLMWKWGGRAVAFNMTTALLSVLCFIFFALFLYKLRSRDSLLGGLTLAFTPVVFIHSTDSMDYVWALSPILCGFYCILEDWSFLGGVCMGLAIGCRITSAAMLIPASLMLVYQCRRLDPPRLLKFLLPALFIGIGSYVPVMLRYGLSFWSFVDRYPSTLKIVYVASIGVWGTIGLLAILLSMIVFLFSRRFTRSVSIPAQRLLVIAWISGLVLYGIAFLRLPHEAGYLIPIVPFTILLLGRFLERRLFIGVCVAVIVSSFVLSVEKAGIYLSGPILRDHQVRRETSTLIEQTISLDEASREKRVVVSGWLLPMIEARLGSDVDGQTQYVELLTSSELHEYRKRGYSTYYLPGMREYNLRVYNVDLNGEGGRILQFRGDH